MFQECLQWSKARLKMRNYFPKCSIKGLSACACSQFREKEYTEAEGVNGMSWRKEELFP